MPCEACNVQFTVFRRKKSCMECRRWYCNQCLAKRHDRHICERCIVFTTRPLSKVELLKLKPKDLIFFLQSKHISTTGCIEKEELVNLVLIHVNNSTEVPPPQRDESCANSFDQLKQTCQNLFTSFTDKISTDLKFDAKSQSTASRSTGTPTSPASPSSQNIFSQPRASRRPSANYSSSSTSQPTSTIPTPTSPLPSQSHLHHATMQSDATSPTTSYSTVTTTRSYSDQPINNATATNNNNRAPVAATPPVPPNKRTRLADIVANEAAGSGSGCECTDDEADDDTDHVHIINSFRRSQSQHSASDLLTSELEPRPMRPATTGSVSVPAAVAGPSGVQQQSVGATVAAAHSSSQINDQTAGTSLRDSDDSSSFEEVAAGSTLMGNVAVTVTHSDADNWQIIGPACSSSSIANPVVPTAPALSASSSLSAVNVQPAADTDTFFAMPRALPQPMSRRRVGRRRSETALMAGQSPRRHFSIDDEEDDDDDDGEMFDNYDVTHHRTPTTANTPPALPLGQRNSKRSICCERCGKRKANIQQYVASFRQQLAAEQVDETEMRRELTAFLAYLEQSQVHGSVDDGAGSAATADDRTASVGDNGIERMMMTANDATADNNETAAQSQPAVQSDGDVRSRLVHSLSANDELGVLDGGAEALIVDDMDDDDFSFGEDDGIHVYGTDDPMTHRSEPKQFFNLTDIQKSSDLDDLNVKQLKEILMLNRVDFKGCCEKNELLERVKRLWNERITCPAIDKLPIDDLCKICMDAPIECVMLECGHMATCTPCGKVLHECPICRQYIVRVVRFFRA